MSVADWIALVTCVATCIYVGLTGLYVWLVFRTLRYIGEQLKTQEETQKLQGALTIFSELYTEVARKARKRVYKEVPDNIEGIEDKKLEEYLEIVQDACFPYQRIGYLIYYGHIGEDPIITTHWQSVWRCWKITEKLIEWARIKRGEPTYFEYFKLLFDVIDVYRIENNLQEPKIY